MLLYGCFYIAVPLLQYLKAFKKFSHGAEFQPLRASPTMSLPQTCCFLEASQGVGWGCGPTNLRPQLEATIPCASVYSGCRQSQWRGSHSFWLCSVNILEQSGCSGGSPEAQYPNNSILYIDIYII